MTDKTIHFIAGLPRSGSTLLCNILNQNPKFHASSTSGILDIVLAIRNQWENVSEFKASPNKAGKEAVMRPILQNYYSTVSRPVIFDKSRGWGGYMELAEHILQRKIKMLVPVRRITDVLGSFENLWRTQSHEWQFPQEKSHFFEWQTVEGRADVWMRNDEPVGIAYNRIRDALNRGYRDRMHFVEFENLTVAPKETIDKVYDFLGEDRFEHNFDHVEQSTNEDDDIHGIPGLHKIRPKVLPVIRNTQSIIGKESYDKYSGSEFWEKW